MSTNYSFQFNLQYFLNKIPQFKTVSIHKSQINITLFFSSWILTSPPPNIYTTTDSFYNMFSN